MKYFFINLILGLFFSIPNWFLRIFFWRKSKFIRDNYLDQQTRIFLKLLDIFGYKLDTDNFSSIERIRSNNARMSLNINKKPTEKMSFNNIFINDDKSVFIREYQPCNIQSDQAILFFHGGGYALGSVETHHNFVASMSLFLGIKVYSLEYGLSPENKFPCALKDAKKAYLMILQKYENKKILLCGDSAGAHLAASLSYDLDQSNIPVPLAQVLIYPMVCPSLNFESMELFKQDFLLTKVSMKWFWDQLRFTEDDNENPRYNLLKQGGKRSSVPRTLIITAGFDPLHDEGSAYANLLENNGGEVLRLHFKDLIHGFVNLTKLRKANSATTKIFETIKKYLTK
tara:strand:- start:8291 stop:9316 length:1026 start_codon:yes stop_codon:yes gene_type:complete